MTSIGRYTILKRLGGGGFGEVFLGEDPQIGRQVAIKVFKPKDENLIAFATSSDEEGLEILRSRFLNEARILASLENARHIVNVLDFGETEDGTPYYVMPYLPHSLAEELGKDVFDALAVQELPTVQRPRALPMAQALDWIEQVLVGLSAAHARGLIHRDLKPSNLMLTDERELRIVDFGIAKAPDGQHSTVSQLGLGSRNYMAPEQRESAKHVDARADVYAVGVVAYRMLTGKLPIGRFADPNVAVPALGQAMNDLLLAMIDTDRSRRPEDGTAALERFKLARASVGEDHGESDTGTWVGEGEASARDELKPLRARIAEVIGENGRIPDHEREGLLALASIADLSEQELDSLIEDVIKADRALAAKSRLVTTLARRIQARKGALDARAIESLDAAASAVDWDRGKLQGLMEVLVDELGLPSVRSNADRETKSKNQASRPLPLRGIAAVLVAVLVLGAGGWGMIHWREGQKMNAAAEQDWQLAQDSDTIAAYEGFIEAWPEARAVSRARERIAELQAQGQSIVGQVQDYLNRLDYRVPSSGSLDPRTESAIRSFEEVQGLPVAGVADEVLLEALQAEYRERDNAAWAEAGQANTEQAYAAYREAFPQGQHIGEVASRVEAARQARLAAEAEAQAAAERRRQEIAAAEAAAAARRVLISSIQRELARLGRPISVDGELGPGTVGQIRAFEAAADRPVTGEATSELLALLSATETWPADQGLSRTGTRSSILAQGAQLVQTWLEERAVTSLTGESQRLGYVIGVDVGASLRNQDLNIRIEFLAVGLMTRLQEEQLWISIEDATEIRQDFIDLQGAGEAYEDTQQLSYVIGMDIAGSLKDQELEFDSKTLIGGIVDAFSNSTTLISQSQIDAERERFMERRRVSLAQSSSSNLTSGQEFLNSNSLRSGVRTTSSGLQYEVLRQGRGRRPGATDRVRVHYVGQLTNGNEFDNSYSRGEPATFELNQVIQGWQEGLQLMREGSKYRFFVPPDLAYGDQSVGSIEANSVLIFEVELLDVE